jgi:energy-coupling factor transporter ATP-binding protein EcfA2
MPNTLQLHRNETSRAIEALRQGQSLLVLGESGSGKSTIAQNVRTALEEEGFRVAIAQYLGSAKTTLVGVAEELGLETTETTANGKERSFTLEELRALLAADVISPRTLLIVDDAQRFPASLRYWLEAVFKAGALILLLGDRPPAAGIFLKVPRIEMGAIETQSIRALMTEEALTHGIALKATDFADLEQRVGGNPALAKRVVKEYVLGIGNGKSTDHRRYIDGTPFLIAFLSVIGIVRFIGLGIGDRSLYIIGGIATILAISLRVLLSQANRRSGKL